MLFLSVCALRGDKNLSSLDISAAFLQSEDLERKVYVQFPKKIQKDRNYVYPLIKALYGFTDAGRQFWLKVRKILKDAGFISLVGDECYYLKYDEEGKLEGQLIIHVDNMLFNG